MDKKNKNILVVGQDSVGIIDVMLEGITQYTSYTYHYINFYPMERNFKYRNFSHRIKNFILKNTVGVNLKKKHFELQVTKSIAEKQPQYEMILIIRPDLLTDEHINQLRAKTSKLMTYYWDTTSFLPRQLSIARYFDYIYSFDPDDCSKYGFTFLPNFYFFDKPSNKCSFEVYYLSSLDERRPTIEKIAKRLKELNISYCFKGYDGREFTNPYILHTYLVDYRSMLQSVAECKVLLDIQKPGQTGLTFRPFEALGLDKKLITTNPHIADYEFYHPENILIIDHKNIKIDREFFRSPYIPVPDHIKKRYHLKTWITSIFMEKPVSGLSPVIE